MAAFRAMIARRLRGGNDDLTGEPSEMQHAKTRSMRGKLTAARISEHEEHRTGRSLLADFVARLLIISNPADGHSRS